MRFSLVHAIKSRPAEPLVWYFGKGKSEPILLSKILNFNFIENLIIA
jgi:hypothetical protein